MTEDEYVRLDAIALAEQVGRKQIDPVELLELMIERAERIDPAIKSICHKLYDEARAQLRSSDPSGPLYGAPFLLKDMRGAIVAYRPRKVVHFSLSILMSSPKSTNIWKRPEQIGRGSCPRKFGSLTARPTSTR